MPYLIYTPKYTQPYVLDDEDSDYLHYFDAWGWQYEHRPATDWRIRHAVALETQLPRRPLYYIWEDEYRRRIREEEHKKKAASKAIHDAEKQAKKEAGEYVKPTLREKVSKVFKKKPEKEPAGYKDGIYVNHLEGLQKEWFEEDGGQQQGYRRIKEDS
jgi:hypothetical protein